MADDASDDRQLMGDRRETATLFVASDLGLARVEVAAAQVGQFGLVSREGCHSVAAEDETVLVATDEGVTLRRGERQMDAGFDAATAVGIDGSWCYAAGPDGTVGRLDRSTLADAGGASIDGDRWHQVGTVSDPRRFDGALLASGDGVVRVGDGLDHLGLAAVRDVDRTDGLAATREGVAVRRDGDWHRECTGDATAVLATDAGTYAIVDGGLREQTEDGWETRHLPGNGQALLLADCGALAVLTADGTVSVAADPAITHDGHGGWRSQAIGLPDPADVAVA